MKILITGALGYIGNQILKKVANKHEIYACDNSSEAIETYYPIWKEADQSSTKKAIGRNSKRLGFGW